MWLGGAPQPIMYDILLTNHPSLQARLGSTPLSDAWCKPRCAKLGSTPRPGCRVGSVGAAGLPWPVWLVRLRRQGCRRQLPPGSGDCCGLRVGSRPGVGEGNTGRARDRGRGWEKGSGVQSEGRSLSTSSSSRIEASVPCTELAYGLEQSCQLVLGVPA